MSIKALQEAIRAKKTPIALGLRPEPDKIAPQILKQFTEMYGPGAMAEAEALRYHGTQAIAAAAEKLSAVMVCADSYLRLGPMGMDVLYNLISAAKSQGLYVILDVAARCPDTWWPTGCDALTVNPYVGAEFCAVPVDKAAFALCRRPEADCRRPPPLPGPGPADGPPGRRHRVGDGLFPGHKGAAPPLPRRLFAAARLRR